MNHTETERITTKQTVQELLSAAMPRPKVIKSGWPRIIGLLALAGLFHWLAGRKFPPRVQGFFGNLSKLGLFAAALTAYSYRDPHREPLGNATDFIYAPADGTVLRVEPVEDEPLFIKGPAYRVLITSQPLDVPVLRAPLPGQVEYILQKTDDATTVGVKSAENRRYLLNFRANPYKRVSLPQPLAAKEPVELFTEAGQTFPVVEQLGVRGFGIALLTTLYVPQKDFEILIRTGQHTQAGMTVLGRIRPGGASLL
jgi:hypothetical protein